MILMGKPEEKRLFRRLRHRWENGIGLYLGDIDWGCRVDSVGTG
jgi:hypothetical protein